MGNAALEQGFITKDIDIDCGHRVTNHGSKCKNFHGHRYNIFATISGYLYEEGEQEGMVLDFGFLKEEMLRTIDAMFDHGMALWRRDPIVLATLSSPELVDVDEKIKQYGIGFLPKSTFWGKAAILPIVPTVENLAKIWAHSLAPRVKARSEGRAKLVKIEAYETRTCSAQYFMPEEQ